ncbi:hypothetical protein MBLNU230_g1228t1 [Neophaeotheca triangularis]
MPASSLWLLPPQNHPLNTALQTLITTLPTTSFKPIAVANHPFKTFIPHITVTSDTTPSTSEPQTWLDGLQLPYSTGELKVRLQRPEAGSVFFRKLTIKVEKNEGVGELAAACREQGTGCLREEAREWVEKSYGPHLSLGYSDLPTQSVEKALPEIENQIELAKSKHPGCETAKGGWLVLVPTHKPVEEWTPVAWRELPGVQWEWHICDYDLL